MTTCRRIRWRRPNLIAIYIFKFFLIYILNLALVLTRCLPAQSTATSKATTRMSLPILCYLIKAEGTPWWLSGKESACNTGDLGSICGSGISPGGRNGNPIQDSCLGNPMDRGTWWPTVHRVTKGSDMTYWLKTTTFFIIKINCTCFLFAFFDKTNRNCKIS